MAELKKIETVTSYTFKFTEAETDGLVKAIDSATETTAVLVDVCDALKAALDQPEEG